MTSTGNLTSILLVVAAVSLIFVLRPSLTKLTVRPRNMAVVAENDVIISCSSDRSLSSGSWMRFSDGGRVELFRRGRKVPDVDGRKYTMGSSGGLDLTVRQVRAEDAGLYVCSDEEQHASAHLLVIMSSPTCSVGTSSPQLVDVVEGDRLPLSCNVSFADYIGYLTLHYNWTTLTEDDDEQRPLQITSSTEDTDGVARITARWPRVPRLRCFVHFRRSAASSYTDAASNVPRYRGDCTTKPINVLSQPRDININKTFADLVEGRQLHCSAAGRPAPTYQWYRVSDANRSDDDELLAVGNTLELHDVGSVEVYCTAVNVVRGVRHRLSSNVVRVLSTTTSRHDVHWFTHSGLEVTRNDDHSAHSDTISRGPVLYRDNATLHILMSNSYFAYFLVAMCAAGTVLLIAATIVIGVCIRCRRNKLQQQRQQPQQLQTEEVHVTNNESELAATTFTTQSSMPEDSQNEQQQHGNDEAVDEHDETRLSDIYDDIVSVADPTEPVAETSNEYNTLILADVAPVVASPEPSDSNCTDVYSPLQRNNNTLTKITIAVGKCDLSIVVKGGEAETTSSIQHISLD